MMIHSLVPLICSATLAAAELINTNAIDPEHAPEVAESELVKMSITVRNPHAVAVEIAPIEPCCSSTTLIFASTTLAPHATTELSWTFESPNRSGDQRYPQDFALTDPALAPISVVAVWRVRAHVQVDWLSTPDTDPLARPARAFQDCYRYPSKVRAGELATLRKRIRLSCPAGETPAGGLQVTGVEYPGKLWGFTPSVQSDGSVLIDGRIKEDAAPIEKHLYSEEVTVLTNHPKKARIPLAFFTFVTPEADAAGAAPEPKR